MPRFQVDDPGQEVALDGEMLQGSPVLSRPASRLSGPLTPRPPGSTTPRPPPLINPALTSLLEQDKDQAQSIDVSDVSTVFFKS